MTPIRSAALSVALILSPLVALAAPAPEPMRFTSQSIEMPTSDRIFPDGPGAEAVNNNCLACHSAGMVLTQPKLTKAQWTETVNKMVHIYKAPVDQADVQTIVDYLTALKPTPELPNPEAAAFFRRPRGIDRPRWHLLKAMHGRTGPARRNPISNPPARLAPAAERARMPKRPAS